MSLSPGEQFHLHGRLEPAQIEALLEDSAALARVRGIAAHLEEAKAQYPAEDCLQAQQEALVKLAGQMRGQHRSALLKIIGDLETQILSLVNDGQYGADELRRVLDALRVGA